MAYTPINWQTGDVITADKLNKMDNGWSVENTQLFSETVTTVAGESGNFAQLSYSGTNIPETMLVEFDGTIYECAKQVAYGNYFWGAPNPSDFSTYPFVVLYSQAHWSLVTQTAGEHTITATASILQTSSDFNAAVKASNDFSTLPFLCVPAVTTYNEMNDAARAGRLLYFYADYDGYYSGFHLVIGFNREASETAVTAYPAGTSNIETYGFNSDMVFTVFRY